MGFDDIVRMSTDWPAETQFDSVFQHQNLDEHPKLDFDGTTTTQLHWFQNPGSVPVILTVITFPLKDKLKVLVWGNEQIITPANAEKINKMLCDMIAKLSASL
ncbi:destruxin synthetase [Pyrenophora seminiperda CCB06]|uniref:Destruxin synthetase n=1 Tax=Pyrenophora seminiperda CCB06 TaxID=1302712 RepID=A0A3M7MC26_9PLEO|nr:destruxin synthetase [Pyrenophora seminiperda CCB06]